MWKGVKELLWKWAHIRSLKWLFFPPLFNHCAFVKVPISKEETGPVADKADVLISPVLYPFGKGFFPIAQLLGGGTQRDIPRDMSFAWNALRRMRPMLGEADLAQGALEVLGINLVLLVVGGSATLFLQRFFTPKSER